MILEVDRIFLFIICILLAERSVGQGNNDTTRTFKIGIATGLQFDMVRFSVRPSSKVKIILSNTDDMIHNLLITQQGMRLKVVEDALKLGGQGPAMNYNPGTAEVLWAITAVEPNDSKSISFTAPALKGVYPYVCTLPGHGFIMFGAMYVTDSDVLPDIKTDPNLPPGRNVTNVPAAHPAHNDYNSKPLHPYTPTSPYLYRVFIQGASPAAIAVSLPHALSYCWDAATCNLRFAWEGGFLDNSDLWKGKGDAAAKITGDIFYQSNRTFPFRINNEDSVKEKKYKGYRLINRYPEFHYKINNMNVYELIVPNTTGTGIVRNFRIPDAGGVLWFYTDAGDGVAFTSSAGKWEGGKLKLTAREARRFSIQMTIKKQGG